MHEPKPGAFNFQGGADLARFVKIAQEVGLYVIIRPGPYACAEWEFGGYPAWLLKDHHLEVRSMDERYLKASQRYLERLAQEIAPLQNTRGGPIIMVQFENEYGSYGKDNVPIWHAVGWHFQEKRDTPRVDNFRMPRNAHSLWSEASAGHTRSPISGDTESCCHCCREPHRGG